MKMMPVLRLLASLTMIVVPPAVYFGIVRPSLAASNDPESIDLFAKVLGGALMVFGLVTAPIWLNVLVRRSARHQK